MELETFCSFFHYLMLCYTFTTCFVIYVGQLENNITGFFSTYKWKTLAHYLSRICICYRSFAQNGTFNGKQYQEIITNEVNCCSDLEQKTWIWTCVWPANLIAVVIPHKGDDTSTLDCCSSPAMVGLHQLSGTLPMRSGLDYPQNKPELIIVSCICLEDIKWCLC